MIKSMNRSQFIKNGIHIKGGEPLLWQEDKGFLSLLKWLYRKQFHVTLETNGTQFISPRLKKYINFLKIYPKLNFYPNSHSPQIINSFSPFPRIYIFDVNNEIQLDNAYIYIHQYNLKEDIYLKPADNIGKEFITTYALLFLKRKGINAKILYE